MLIMTTLLSISILSWVVRHACVAQGDRGLLSWINVTFTLGQGIQGQSAKLRCDFLPKGKPIHQVTWRDEANQRLFYAIPKDNILKTYGSLAGRNVTSNLDFENGFHELIIDKASGTDQKVYRCEFFGNGNVYGQASGQLRLFSQLQISDGTGTALIKGCTSEKQWLVTPSKSWQEVKCGYQAAPPYVGVTLNLTWIIDETSHKVLSEGPFHSKINVTRGARETIDIKCSAVLFPVSAGESLITSSCLTIAWQRRKNNIHTNFNTSLDVVAFWVFIGFVITIIPIALLICCRKFRRVREATGDQPEQLLPMKGEDKRKLKETCVDMKKQKNLPLLQL